MSNDNRPDTTGPRGSDHASAGHPRLRLITDAVVANYIHELATQHRDDPVKRVQRELHAFDREAALEREAA